MADAKSHIFTKFVGTIHVKPRNQSRLELGKFSADAPAKGVSIEFEPDLKPLTLIDTHIIQQGDASRYTLILHVANKSNRTITATVWGM